MGISRDSMHKRRETGGKKKAWRKKRKYELGRQSANTKLSSNKTIRRIRLREIRRKLSKSSIMSTKTNRQKRLCLRSNPNLVSGSPPESTSEIATVEDTLPIDMVAEIFCRLPVKLLVQLRCMCKPWNSLISDHWFTRKHLSLSTTRRLHYAEYVNKPYKFIHNSYPLESVLTDMPTEFKQPRIDLNSMCGSCDGILCIADIRKGVVVLWNPSIRKSKKLPPFETCEILKQVYATYGFGYDPVSHNYKVVVVYSSENNLLDTTKVKLHTLGTNLWITIHNFPFGAVFASESGTYVRGTLNWVAYTGWRREGPLFILSFDLGTDSYQKLLPPDDAEICQSYLTLSVLRDCLCLISNHPNHPIWVMKEYGVWVMKEYGVQDSWTRLLSVCMQHPIGFYDLSRVLYIFEDDRLLLETEEDWKTKVVVYDPNNDTFKITWFKNSPNVCVETLISPCF